MRDYKPFFACVFLASPAFHALGQEGPRGFEADGAVERFRIVLQNVEGTLAPTLVGYDRWDELVQKHKPLIEDAKEHPEFARRLNEMFAEAQISHLHYYDDTDWRYWLLGSRRVFGGGPEAINHIGLFPQKIDGHWFVRGILEGSPAASSGLLVGDRILAVDGQEFHPFLSFQGKSQPVTLKFARSPDDLREAAITPTHQALMDGWAEATRKSIRIIQHGEMRFAYMHVWSTFDQGEYDDLVALHDEVSGLILDFREGYGGSTVEVSRLLIDRLGQESRWQKPAIILTSYDGTRSAKELVAAEARAMHKVRLVGTETAGAVLPCTFLPVATDGLLVRPMHWNPLEGRPLEPDVRVERDIRYCAGEDPQLEKGKDVLADFVKAWRPRPRQALPAEAESTPADDASARVRIEKHPERLSPLPTTPYFLSHKVRWKDVDGDGARELLAPSVLGRVEVISSDGATAETLNLQGIESENLVGDIVPLTIDGLPHWFVAYWPFDIDRKEEPVAALFTQTGERVWEFRPDIPNGSHGEMSLDAGNLDDEAGLELVVGLRTYTSRRRSPIGWFMDTGDSYLLVLDAYGDLLCQRKLHGPAEFVEVVESKDVEGKPLLLVGTRDGLRRFSFSLDAQPESAEFED